MIEMDDGTMQVGAPKTSAGVRTVALPSHLLVGVEAHLSTYVGGDPDAWVFLGPKGALRRRSNFAVVFQRAKTTAGLGSFTFHDLRHFAATTAAGIPGVTTRDLMSRMGYSSARAALLYQHAAAGRDASIAASLTLLSQASPGGRS